MAKTKTRLIEEMIRVNHAGEYGAVRIYKGQMAVLGENDPTLNHMASQEKEHLRVFTQMVQERSVQPSILQPFWYVGGYLMGALPALLGRKAAHACTIAVENVIEEHYQEQIEALENMPEEAELKNVISRFREEEIEHKNTAKDEGGENAAGYPVLTGVIQAITKSAIFLSKRI
jgi:ubiquinone biosynthesis monooxygenase Coq7